MKKISKIFHFEKNYFMRSAFFFCRNKCAKCTSAPSPTAPTSWSSASIPTPSRSRTTATKPAVRGTFFALQSWSTRPSSAAWVVTMWSASCKSVENPCFTWSPFSCPASWSPSWRDLFSCCPVRAKPTSASQSSLPLSSFYYSCPISFHRPTRCRCCRNSCSSRLSWTCCRHFSPWLRLTSIIVDRIPIRCRRGWGFYFCRYFISFSLIDREYKFVLL